MKFSLPTSSRASSYFLAGALLPTLAYVVILIRQQRATDASKEGESSRGGVRGEYDESEELSDGTICPFVSPEEPLDASSWGTKDAPFQLVLCVNQELLDMERGIIVAQCCRAALGCYKRAMKQCPMGLRAWEKTICAKMAAVQCSDESEMNDILGKAAAKGIPYCVVDDAGRTQHIGSGSSGRAVLGLGPAPVLVFEGITNHLKFV